MDNIDGFITKDNVYRLLSDYRAHIPNDIRHAMCEKVKEFPSVDVTQNWISTTDRLPKDGEKVLIVMPTAEQKYIHEAIYNYKRNVFYGDRFCCSQYVISWWMPFPKLPKEE